MKTTLRKKVLAVAAVLLIGICCLTACEKEENSSEEATLEALDVVMMDKAETLGLHLFHAEDEVRDYYDQLFSDGLWYDPVRNYLAMEKPEKGYGFGTEEDGGETWCYYCAIDDGYPVKAYYDSKKDYRNMAIKVQCDKEREIVYYNWVTIE